MLGGSCAPDPRSVSSNKGIKQRNIQSLKQHPKHKAIPRVNYPVWELLFAQSLLRLQNNQIVIEYYHNTTDSTQHMCNEVSSTPSVTAACETTPSGDGGILLICVCKHWSRVSFMSVKNRSIRIQLIERRLQLGILIQCHEKKNINHPFHP